MTAAAIHARGLSKRYGDDPGARGPRPRRSQSGEVYGYLGPNGSGKTTTIRLLLGLHRPSAGHAALFGIDAWRDPVAAHRRVAYVAGEPFLWPALTSAETFAFLASLHGGTDERLPRSARRALPARRSTSKVRALSKGNRQKVQLIAALATRAELLILDEPTERPRSADGGRLPRERARSQGARADDLPLLAHPQRGRGAVRPRRHPARAGGWSTRGRSIELRHLSAQTVEVTFAGPAPTLPPLAGVSVRRAPARTRCAARSAARSDL